MEPDRLYMGAGWVAPDETGTYGAAGVQLPAASQPALAVDEARARRERAEFEAGADARLDAARFAARLQHGAGADLSVDGTLGRARVAMERSEAAAARTEQRMLVELQQPPKPTAEEKVAGLVKSARKRSFKRMVDDEIEAIKARREERKARLSTPEARAHDRELRGPGAGFVEDRS
jgi:hypothetical protein